MRRLYAVLLCVLSCSAYAEQVMATNIGQSNGPSFDSSLCYYETWNNFRFSIVIDSSFCPLTVYYDTRTGKVIIH